MSESIQPENGGEETAPVPAGEPVEGAEESQADRLRHDHDDQMVDEWEDESFPASDPPGHY